MNYRGSCKKLLGNSKAAMLAAIEIYNKPRIEYRDECVVILLINAWELILKAILSKNGQSIYYPKKRGQPYRTLSWTDAFREAAGHMPKAVQPVDPLKANLELLAAYRDNAVHFYNAGEFGVVFYALAQTCIQNYRDVVDGVFGVQLEKDISWQLLPLGIREPLDVMEYLSSGGDGAGKETAVGHFLGELSKATAEVEKTGGDTGRLLTVFNIKLESVKKIGDADTVVGMDGEAGGEGPLAFVRTQDPNKSHPLLQMEVLEELNLLHGEEFNSRSFQALVWKHDLKNKAQYCWMDQKQRRPYYSRDVVSFVKQRTKAEIAAARTAYSEHLSKKRKANKKR